MRNCLHCNTILGSTQKKYCSLICLQDQKRQVYIERWKAGLEDGKRGELQISNFIRKYLFDKFGGKCTICGWCEVNPCTGKVPLDVEHIDGNPYNNREDNLTLICPNCHSLTCSYKSLNKGKGRKNRK